MACGVRLVATDVPGTREVLPEATAGLRVGYGAEDERVEAVVALAARSRAAGGHGRSGPTRRCRALFHASAGRRR
jgi:glycosyltransferase involved in cell wall biosynthesis